MKKALFVLALLQSAGAFAQKRQWIASVSETVHLP